MVLCHFGHQVLTSVMFLFQVMFSPYLCLEFSTGTQTVKKVIHTHSYRCLLEITALGNFTSRSEHTALTPSYCFDHYYMFSFNDSLSIDPNGVEQNV